MAIAFNHRNDYFYDLDGPYNRRLFDNSGTFRGVSPEWRGLLKHDWSVTTWPAAPSRTTAGGLRSRFGASATNNFNKASDLKLGGAAIVPFGGNREWALEVGYNQWLWGRSARKYHEPYVSLGRSF